MRKIKADLHIHSALSPCGSLDMSPSAIVQKAKAIGLDVIAITDHHAIDNALWAVSIGKKENILVLAGLEVQSSEEVHLLCLFDESERAERFHQYIYSFLPSLKNNPELFGDQPVVDDNDNIIRFEERLLINSLKLSLMEIKESTEEYGGIVIPSHVEADKFGLMKNLGIIPPELTGGIFEISYFSTPQKAITLYPQLQDCRFIVNSDAHYLEEIGRGYTGYDLDFFSLKNMIKAVLSGHYELFSFLTHH